MPSMDLTSSGGGPRYVSGPNVQVSCSDGSRRNCKLLNGVKYSLIGYDLISEMKYGLKLMELGASACGDEEDDYTHLLSDSLTYDATECVNARRKGKRIVNTLWLDHISKFGHLVDDTKAVYQPSKGLNAIKGASLVRICSSGYTEYEKELQKSMAKLIGAEYSGSFKSGWATHLICSKFEGYKFERAKEKNMRIANHLWLEECVKHWKLLPVGDYTKHDEPKGLNDWKQFVSSIKNDLFCGEQIPRQLRLWLSRISKDPVKDKGLILSHSSIQGLLGNLSLFSRMYNRFLVLDRIDSKALSKVLQKLKKYNGWQKKQLINQYLEDTFVRVDPHTNARIHYSDDLYGLLRLMLSILTYSAIFKKRCLMLDMVISEVAGLTSHSMSGGVET
ncbi:hypothetical protein EJB05_45488 [Eragrostis curvula]|uniref:BRCT domain-containing protein n=1 Tax=Eragrostis curvula TaxID=38414 RepID=A0A5J9TLU8_9POAL|nr:hypothetical protein EJB05_45488 [Eragrostis curvula]